MTKRAQLTEMYMWNELNQQYIVFLDGLTIEGHWKYVTTSLLVPEIRMIKEEIKNQYGK